MARHALRAPVVRNRSNRIIVSSYIRLYILQGLSLVREASMLEPNLQTYVDTPIKFHPNCTTETALSQAVYWLEEGDLAAAAVWGRIAAQISESDALW